MRGDDKQIYQSILNKLHLFNAMQEKDIAAEAVSEPVRMFGYDTKKAVNEQGRTASSW